VGHHTEAFVGIETSKSRNAIAIADGGRGGEGWSGRAPAPPAIEAGKGRQDKEHAVS
jgi:transposase